MQQPLQYKKVDSAYDLDDSEPEYYYETHSTLEDIMPESSLHAELVEYLMSVLRWMLRGQVCALHENLSVFYPTGRSASSLVPDLSVFQGSVPRDLSSWKIGQTGPAPQVVFEIASHETWEKDLREKPRRYARMGVKEYMLYDPNTPPYLRPMKRLMGWHLHASGHVVALESNPKGWLWSEQLESYLVPNGALLRLYDEAEQRRLTEAEAHKQDKQLVEQENRMLVQENDVLAEDNDTLEREKRTLAREKRTLAREKRRAEQRAADFEQQAQTLAQEKRLLAEKLRALGINPDEL